LIATKNTPYYLIAIGLFIFLKFCFKLADNDSLAFLLFPTDKFVGLLTSSKSVYFSDKGYYHERLNILIEKSCSGFNFMLLCFSMLSFLVLKYANKPLHKALIIPAVLVLAYILTIFVNASRIVASIIIQNQVVNFLPQRSHSSLHESIGVTTNLLFLIFIYFLMKRILNNHHRNEKPS